MNSLLFGGNATALVPWIVVIGASLAGAVADARTRRIPNFITLPTVLCGLLWSLYRSGLAGLVDSLGGCIVAALPFVMLYAFGGGGAGDAKMMGAVGAWLGMRDGLVALLAVVVAGAVLGLAYALLRGRIRGVAGRLRDAVSTLAMTVASPLRGSFRFALPDPEAMLAMPYGVSIFAGVCCAAAGVALWQVYFL